MHSKCWGVCNSSNLLFEKNKNNIWLNKQLHYNKNQFLYRSKRERVLKSSSTRGGITRVRIQWDKQKDAVNSERSWWGFWEEVLILTPPYAQVLKCWLNGITGEARGDRISSVCGKYQGFRTNNVGANHKAAESRTECLISDDMNGYSKAKKQNKKQQSINQVWTFK